jgi:hypothetical protein
MFSRRLSIDISFAMYIYLQTSSILFHLSGPIFFSCCAKSSNIDLFHHRNFDSSALSGSPAV